MTTKAKPGRPRESAKPRANLSASIAGETNELLGLWCAQLQNSSVGYVHVGRVLDRLAQFGKTYQFDRTLKMKKPLRPSEATAATSQSKAK
jgi:hypothetical protein